VLTLLATDIEIQITTSTPDASGEGDGAVTVGARKLQEILRSLPEARKSAWFSTTGACR
jgi:DNA polymerase-3 subunit beta